MSATEKPAINLLARQEVLRWDEALERLKVEETDMKARHAAEERAIRDQRTKLTKLVEAGMALVDMDAQPELQAASEESAAPVVMPDQPKTKKQRTRRGGKSWTATIKRIITKSGLGMTHSEVKAEVTKTHLGKTLQTTEKSFYGAIGRLSESGDIIKHKGRLYSPKAYHRFMKDVAAGIAVDTPAPSSAGSGVSPNEIAIKRFLESRPNGATTSDIVDNLLNSPPDDLAVTKNRNSIYNLLSRQRENKNLIRRGDRYYLPSQIGETPDSEESGAQDHNGNGDGTSSSSGNGVAAPIAHPGASPAHPGE